MNTFMNNGMLGLIYTHPFEKRKRKKSKQKKQLEIDALKQTRARQKISQKINGKYLLCLFS